MTETEQSGPLDLWQPTAKLRHVRKHQPSRSVQELVLQQLFRHTTSGEVEWRDVPIVEEPGDE